MSDDGFFVITRLHRDDFESRGYDPSSLTDDEMKRIASKMGDVYVEHLFWDGIDHWAQEHNLPEVEYLHGKED